MSKRQWHEEIGSQEPKLVKHSSLQEQICVSKHLGKLMYSGQNVRPLYIGFQTLEVI